MRNWRGVLKWPSWVLDHGSALGWETSFAVTRVRVSVSVQIGKSTDATRKPISVSIPVLQDPMARFWAWVFNLSHIQIFWASMELVR